MMFIEHLEKNEANDTAPNVSPVSAGEALKLCHDKMREAAEYIDGNKTNREIRSNIKTTGDRIAEELRSTITATASSGAPDFDDKPDAYLYKSGGPWDIAFTRQECTYGGAPAVSIVPVWFVTRDWKSKNASSGGLRVPDLECGWLVENGKQGDELRYRTWIDGLPDWTSDHNEATRYCRRIDAERAHQEDEDAFGIVEHAWHTAPTPPVVKESGNVDMSDHTEDGLGMVSAEPSNTEPEFSTDPDGEIAIEWYLGDDTISISIGGIGKLSWVADISGKIASGSRQFNTEQPQAAQSDETFQAAQPIAVELTDERIEAFAMQFWNKLADGYNQWATLGSDERGELIEATHALLAHPGAESKDAERLRFVGLHGLDANEYGFHVLKRGGTGDLSDIRSFIDAAIQNGWKA